MSFREAGVIYDPEEALVAAAFLRAAGYDIFLTDHHTLNQWPTHRIALGGYRLMTHGADCADARSILDEIRSAPMAIAPPCAHCGESDFRRVRTLWFPIVMWFFFGQLAPFVTNSHYIECRTCRARFHSAAD